MRPVTASEEMEPMEGNYRRSRALAVLAFLAAAAAVALAACGSSNSPHVASLAMSGGSNGGATSSAGTITTSAGGSTTNGGGSATNLAKGNPTALVDEWAACERAHGDTNQADPTIDAHGVINITTPPMGSGIPAGDPHGVTGTCSQYLAAAQRALRAADPVQDPLGMDNQADLLKYVNCMRTSGVPNYPYPTGNSTNFNGTGVDPNSPSVIKISIKCGNKLGLPLWWSAGWGPPGDVTVGPSNAPGSPPRGSPRQTNGSAGQGFSPAPAPAGGG